MFEIDPKHEKKYKIYLKLRLFSHSNLIISQALVSLYASLPLILCQLLFAKMDQESIILEELFSNFEQFGIILDLLNTKLNQKEPKNNWFSLFY